VTEFIPVELMYGQKPIMPTERTILSWAALDWRDEMSREELLAARIRQLERRPEDVERAAEKLRTARIRNKERFNRTNRLRPKKIEKGDWVLVYDSSLDNQHEATRKFARRWFGPYVVTTVNDNGTYHLAELDGKRIAVPVAGKRVKAFKKRHDNEPDLGIGESDDDDTGRTDGELIIKI
jgi:hypothetical protein